MCFLSLNFDINLYFGGCLYHNFVEFRLVEYSWRFINYKRFLLKIMIYFFKMFLIKILILF